MNIELAEKVITRFNSDITDLQQYRCDGNDKHHLYFIDGRYLFVSYQGDMPPVTIGELKFKWALVSCFAGAVLWSSDEVHTVIDVKAAEKPKPTTPAKASTKPATRPRRKR